MLLHIARRRGWPELGEVGAEDGSLEPPLVDLQALEPRVGEALTPQVLLQNLDLLPFDEEVVQRELRGQASKRATLKNWRTDKEAVYTGVKLVRPTVSAFSAKLWRPLFPAALPSAEVPPSAEERFPEPHTCSAHFSLRSGMQLRGSGRSPEEAVVATHTDFAPQPKWTVTFFLLPWFATATKMQQPGNSCSHALRSISGSKSMVASAAAIDRKETDNVASKQRRIDGSVVDKRKLPTTAKKEKRP